MKMILNPNKKEREEIVQAIKDNSGYCPCMIEQNKDTMCPCKDKRENDICICGLWVRI